MELSAMAVTLACIYPFIRNVDDLFSISTELIIVTAAIVLLASEAHESRCGQPRLVFKASSSIQRVV